MVDGGEDDYVPLRKAARAQTVLEPPRTPPSCSSTTTIMSADNAVLTQILAQLQSLQVNQQAMQAKVRPCD